MRRCGLQLLERCVPSWPAAKRLALPRLESRDGHIPNCSPIVAYEPGGTAVVDVGCTGSVQTFCMVAHMLDRRAKKWDTWKFRIARSAIKLRCQGMPSENTQCGNPARRSQPR